MNKKNLDEETRRLLEQSLLQGEEVDTKVRRLLKSEYLRLLAKYRRIDYLMSQKYNMTFGEFVNGRVTRKNNYTWDVETDAMDWENAVSGIKTMEIRLKELQETELV